MIIKIEFDTVDDLVALIKSRDKERDALRDRVKELESTPLQYSLRGLAQKVADETLGLTPDQERRMKESIEKGL